MYQSVHNKSQLAFTLIEQCLAIGLLAVLTLTAIPSWSGFLTKTKIRATGSELHTTLMKARNHALENHVTVIVCEANSEQMSQCNKKRQRNTNWIQGWIAYADSNDNGELDSDEDIFHVSQNLNRIPVVFNQTGRLRFFTNGTSRSAGFYICHPGSETEAYIRLLYSGRSRISAELNTRQRSICQNSAASET